MFIKIKVKKIATEQLQNLKESHSKLDDINFDKLECAQYLVDSRLNKREARLLFNLRTRMYKVKANYRGNHLYNMVCDLCRSATCDQRHLMECSVLHQEVPELRNNINVKYQHLFGSLDNMVPAIKLFSAITKRREELLDELVK